jgi:hypothetical protein
MFRVYAVVRDGHGNAAFASAPINVNLDEPLETKDPSGGDRSEGPGTEGKAGNTVAIVGGVLGGITAIVLVVAAAVCCVKKREAPEGWVVP